MSSALNGFSLSPFISPAQDWYKKVSYADAKNIIKEKMMSSVENFIAIGYHLKHISETGQYKEDGYPNIWECARNEFGFSQAKTSRCINICKAYSVGGDSPYIDEKFKHYSTSQLQEMLPFKDDEGVMGQITPSMSSREIRRKIQDVVKKDAGTTDREDAERAGEKGDTLTGQMRITTIEGEYRELALPPGDDTAPTSLLDRRDRKRAGDKVIPSSMGEGAPTEDSHPDRGVGTEGQRAQDLCDGRNAENVSVSISSLSEDDDPESLYDPGRITVLLPCAVGDTVYLDLKDEVKTGIIDQIILGEGMEPRFRMYVVDDGKWYHFEVSDLGQMIFFSYEKASES